MHYKDYGNPAGHLLQCFEHVSQINGGIHIGRPMQGNEGIAAGGKTAGPIRAGSRQSLFNRTRKIQTMVERVNHHITNKLHPVADYPFLRQIIARATLCGVKNFSQLIRKNSIQLFRHAAVITAQSCLDMDHGNGFSGSGQRTSQG